MSDDTMKTQIKDGISRRSLVKAGLGAVAAPAVLSIIPAHAQSKTIKIGHVSPRTGPLAGFGEADNFIIEQVRGVIGKGIEIGGKTYPVQIISKDSQSSGSRAAEVASELILGDKVDLLLGAAAPDTTNPVADQAEVNEVPCLTTNCGTARRPTRSSAACSRTMPTAMPGAIRSSACRRHSRRPATSCTIPAAIR
jgi:branched-chain amino acid transport system substrate-binding protein